MADRSSIEWTEATWNPTTGCDRVSPGCDNCYALTLAKRLKGMGSAKYQRDGDASTSGPGFGLSVHSDVLHQPMRWRKPRRVFVNSMSDLFHDAVPDRFIADVFAVMSIAAQHTYQVLTKRHARMRSLLNSVAFWTLVNTARNVRGYLALPGVAAGELEPLPSVWLGVSVEDQHWADIRIPALLETPAAVRWVSAEPLLGAVDLSRWLGRETIVGIFEGVDGWENVEGRGITWVVCGGESGPGARPMHPDWARSLRDQCVAAGVPFFLKQLGQYAPISGMPSPGDIWLSGSGHQRPMEPGDGYFRRAGYTVEYLALDGGRNSVLVRREASKHAAGRELDGREWSEYPVVAHGAA
jgi:protein gp37